MIDTLSTYSGIGTAFFPSSLARFWLNIYQTFLGWQNFECHFVQIGLKIALFWPLWLHVLPFLRVSCSMDICYSIHCGVADVGFYSSLQGSSPAYLPTPETALGPHRSTSDALVASPLHQMHPWTFWTFYERMCVQLFSTPRNWCVPPCLKSLLYLLQTCILVSNGAPIPVKGQWCLVNGVLPLCLHCMPHSVEFLWIYPPTACNHLGVLWHGYIPDGRSDHHS